MVEKQHHFVLVHGAGHGAWCWVKVVAVLDKAGHRATTIDLASAGENTDIADEVTSLEQYSQPLEDLLASLPDDEKVILVGHSRGGMSVTRMSELFPTKPSVAVYLAALMPPPGIGINELMASDPDFQGPLAGKLARFLSKVEGGPITSMEFPIEGLKENLYNKCSAEDFAFAAGRIKKFPLARSLLEQVQVTVENYGSVPRVYVIATHDKATIPAMGRKMIALNPPAEVYEIDADHSLFFSAVEDVEKILLNVAAKYDS